MKTSPFVWVLVMVGLGSLAGCGVTMSELRALNPNATTLQVPCHPWQVPENVKLFAYRENGDHLASDETPDELREFAPHASVFIEVDKAAPRENAQIMATDYGLVCQEYLEVRSTPLEALREEKPCSMAANSPGSRQLVGNTNNQPCNPGAGGPSNGATGSGSAPAALPRIGVCTHPDGITSDEWYGGKGITADVKTKEEHKAQVAKATVVFFLDPSAPPESIWYFGPNVKARCPGKAPMPYKDWVAQNGGTSTQQAGSGSSGTGKQQAGNGNAGTGTAGTNTTNTSATPKKGDEKTTDTSSSTGQGPPLSFFERLSRNMALAGALAQGDTSGNAKDPNGHRNGIPSGTNVGGWTFPPLQAGVSLFQIISAVGLKPKELVDKIAAATKQGQRVIISEVDKDALKMVDQLILDAGGRAELAKGFQQVGSVMPFSMGQKVTQGLESKFQAHKPFEAQAFKYFETIFGPDKKALDTAIAKAPSVILTDAEHQVITNKLNAFWRTVKKEGWKPPQVKKKLIELYQDVYKDHPHWLQSIQHLLIQLP